MDALCQESLVSFNKNDIRSLTNKAKNLITENTVREGFEPHTFFVKSSSKTNPHLVKSSPNATFTCDADCLGFKTRRVCSHVIAVVFTQKKLSQFLSQFSKAKNTTAATLTSITCASVNRDAVRKRPATRKDRKKSRDPMTGMRPVASQTSGDLFNNQEISDVEEVYAAESTPSKPLTIRLKKK